MEVSEIFSEKKKLNLKEISEKDFSNVFSRK